MMSSPFPGMDPYIESGELFLNLQPMIAAIYKRSRYEQDIDYSQPCRPPLSPAESAWFESRLRELGAKAKN